MPSERLMNATFPFRPVVDVMPPDITPYRKGNTGVDFVTTVDSGKPGPHVMVNALTHGNEICGAHVLHFLFEHDVRPRRGRLTLSFANVEAFARFDAERPHSSRYVDEDFNRLWSDDVLDSRRQSRELERARALRPLVAEADYLLDIHSMYFPSSPLLLAGLQPRARALAQKMGYPGYIVSDKGHRAGPRMRDYNRFDHPRATQTALLVECGQHWSEASVSAALATTLRFLRCLDVVKPDFVAEHLPSEPCDPQTLVHVSEAVSPTCRSFRFTEEFRGFEVIPDAGTVIALDGTRKVRTPYDDCVLVMPSPGERTRPGLTAVRLGRIVS